MPKTDCAGVGIDIEKIATGDALSALKKMVVNEKELQRLRQWQGVYSESVLLTLVFSTKESFYKAAYSQVQRFFGFEALRFQELSIEKQQVIFVVNVNLSRQLQKEQQVVIDFGLPDENIMVTGVMLPFMYSFISL